MKVTAHFSAEEFAQHARHGLEAKPYPEEWIPARLRLLCSQLEVIRAVFDRPIEVISGYRSPAYNAKIGGARRSQHMEGRAADIRVEDMPAQKLYAAVLYLYERGALRALGGVGLYPDFVHVDVRPPDPTRPWLARWTGGRKTS